LSVRAAELTGQQNKRATGDAVAMGVGLILFWPALFFIKGNDAQEAELARVKGEMEAVQKASIAKQCSIQFQTTPPAAKSKETPQATTKPAGDQTQAAQLKGVY
jgi:hypothetical protein